MGVVLRVTNFEKMKLQAALLASASATTLLQPLYTSIAGNIKDTVSAQIVKIKDVSAFSGFSSQIDAFVTQFNDIDDSVFIDLIANVDFASLVNDDGTFDPAALVTVLTQTDGTELIPQSVVDDMTTAILGSMTDDQKALINTSMNYFGEMTDVFQEIMNNEVELSNFLALFNDVSLAMTNFNEAFDNQLLGSSLDLLLEYGTIATRVAEKAVVFWEDAQSLPNQFDLAYQLSKLQVEAHINEMDGSEDESFMCRAAQTGIFEVLEATFEYAPDAIVAKMRGPVEDFAAVFNDFVHGVPYIYVAKDYFNPELVSAMFDQLNNLLNSIAGSIKELSAPVTVFQLNGPLNSYLENQFC